MNKYIALICARGGSKGLPGKNIKPLLGTPLIGWAIKVAQQVDRISRVIVSTDCEEIARVAVEQGAEVPFMRSAELAGDNSPEWLVWRNAVKYLEEKEKLDIDGLVVIPTTAPLRKTIDIDNCLDKYEKEQVDAVITVTDSHRSPYFNMVTTDNNGYSSLVIPPDYSVSRRQDAPVVFDMTTVGYVVNPGFIKDKDRIFDGKIASVYIPSERALDIDTPLDFKIAQCLMRDL